MDRESVERLRFDRRLQRRRGWVAQGEYESHVESLPDVSDKMTTGDETEEAETAPAEEPAAGLAPPVAPVAGDFSTPGSVGGGFGSDSGGGSPS